jgi:hypothetical protein
MLRSAGESSQPECSRSPQTVRLIWAVACTCGDIGNSSSMSSSSFSNTGQQTARHKERAPPNDSSGRWLEVSHPPQQFGVFACTPAMRTRSPKTLTMFLQLTSTPASRHCCTFSTSADCAAVCNNTSCSQQKRLSQAYKAVIWLKLLRQHIGRALCAGKHAVSQ